MKTIIHYHDIWYTVTAEIDPNCSCWMNFNIYEMATQGPDADEDLEFETEKPGHFTTDLEQALKFAHGAVKWDGCSDWYFDEQERVAIHKCRRQQIINIGEVMARCWDYASTVLEGWAGN